MFLQTFLSVFLLIGYVGAKIQWPFSTNNAPYGLGAFLDAEIGTPGKYLLTFK
jgi:hypothetical protein